MNLDFNSETPIYLQLSQSVEDEILKGVFKEEQQIPSTTEISLRYKINPATVAKGYHLLADERIIYKKRGVGMFVCSGARKKLQEKRKKSFYKDYITNLFEEAERLNISIDEIITMIKKGR